MELKQFYIEESNNTSQNNGFESFVSEKNNDNLSSFKKIGNKLSSEIWQVFMMLTLILSISSTVIWYSSVKPVNAQSIFIEADKAKNLTYNNILLIDYEVNDLDKHSLYFEGECRQNVSQFNLNQSYFEESQKKIKDLKSNTNKTIESVSKSNFTPPKSGMEDLNLSFNNYATSAIGTVEEKQNGYKNSLEILNSLAVICQKPIGTVKTEVDQILLKTSEIRNKDTERSLPNQFINPQWIENVETWLEKYQSLSLDKNGDLNATKDLKNKLKKDYLQLFDYENIINPEFLNENSDFKIQENKMLENIKDLEKWQLNYSNKNPGLENKAVYLF